MGPRLGVGGVRGGGAGGSNEIIYSSISRKINFEKSLDLANFVNFADPLQGGRGYTTPPKAIPGPESRKLEPNDLSLLFRSMSL